MSASSFQIFLQTGFCVRIFIFISKNLPGFKFSHTRERTSSGFWIDTSVNTFTQLHTHTRAHTHTHTYTLIHYALLTNIPSCSFIFTSQSFSFSSLLLKTLSGLDRLRDGSKFSSLSGTRWQGLPCKVSVSGLLNCPVLNRRPSYDPTVVPNNCLFAHKAFLCITLPSSLTLIEILLVLEKKPLPWSSILANVLCPLQRLCSAAQCKVDQPGQLSAVTVRWPCCVLGGTVQGKKGKNSGLVKVVVVMVVFMVVVVLVPLHHLCQPPLIEHHAG